MATTFKLLFLCTFFCIMKLNHTQYNTVEGEDKDIISENIEETGRTKKAFVNTKHSYRKNLNSREAVTEGKRHFSSTSVVTTSGRYVIQRDKKKNTSRQNMKSISWLTENMATTTGGSLIRNLETSTVTTARVSVQNVMQTFSPSTTESLSQNHLEDSTAVIYPTEHEIQISSPNINESSGQNERGGSIENVLTFAGGVTQIPSESISKTSNRNETDTSAESVAFTQNVTYISSQNVDNSTENVVKPSTQISNKYITQISGKNKIETTTENISKLANENVKDTSTVSIETVSIETVTKNSSYGAGKPVTPKPELTTDCETPNEDIGICIAIKMCSILVKQLNNTEIWPFIRASKCDESTKDLKDIKVCCGKYDNFRNVTKNIVEDDVLPKSCGTQKMHISPRIIGGIATPLDEYPWMALLIQKNIYGENILGCAGFLIHTNYVITAAHCTHFEMIKERGHIVSVLLGEHNIDTSEDCARGVCANNTQNLKIEKVMTHPDFSPYDKGYHNDIAIIKLKREAVFTDYVRPICLITNDNQTSAKYHLSGWGITEHGNRSSVKMKVDVPHFNQVQCNQKYSKINITIQDTQICAGGEYQKDSCSGDSGGPLMMSNDNETWYAAGIVSFGIGCGEKGWPGVYTNIVKFLPWIKSQIKQTLED